jgi:alkylated DNA repair dioxygenase AlkB
MSKQHEVTVSMSQLDLFGGGEMAIDESFAAAARKDLDETSWVDVVPGWLSGSEELLICLTAAVPFAQHQRRIFDKVFDEPRLTAEYRDINAAPAPVIRDIAKALSRRYGVTYDGLWLNLYRDHRDSTGWHGDWITCKRETCIVPVLSLGAARRFLLKARSGGPSIGLTVAGGDLIVMGGRCQRDWLHAVPKQVRAAGPRVSLNFESSWQRTPLGPAIPASSTPG